MGAHIHRNDRDGIEAVIHRPGAPIGGEACLAVSYGARCCPPPRSVNLVPAVQAQDLAYVFHPRRGGDRHPAGQHLHIMQLDMATGNFTRASWAPIVPPGFIPPEVVPSPGRSRSFRRQLARARFSSPACRRNSRKRLSQCRYPAGNAIWRNAGCPFDQCCSPPPCCPGSGRQHKRRTMPMSPIRETTPFR